MAYPSPSLVVRSPISSQKAEFLLLRAASTTLNKQDFTKASEALEGRKSPRSLNANACPLKPPNLPTKKPEEPSFAVNSDGGNPECVLLLSGNILYGTAYQGGTNGAGTVYAINTNGTNFVVLHNFTNNSNQNGNSDGAYPEAGLILSGNILYGTTFEGGNNSLGSIFSMNTNGSGYATLYSFIGGTDECGPQVNLVLSGNTLYGTTDGASEILGFGSGTVFSVNTDGSGYRTLHSFTLGTDQGFPMSGLIITGNTLYGTTQFGGIHGLGTIFTVNTDGTNFDNFYSFDGTIGMYPEASVILSGNNIYGNSLFGGLGYGTVYEITLPPSLIPTVQTSPASDADALSATFNGTVNPNGATTTAYFQYGTDATYGTTTDTVSVGNGTSIVSLSATVSKLMPNTIYHYQAVAVAGGVSYFGNDQTVITDVAVTTLSASGVQNLAATLNGTVNPNGLPTTAYFQYGPTTAYGTMTSTQTVGSGTSSVSVSASISGLAPDTIYHYQLVSVIGGVSYFGTDQTVTTQPSLLTLANLCSDVYNDQPIGFAGTSPNPIPYTYITHGTAANPAFAAAAYASADNTQVVIAFRGTIFGTENDDTDLEMFKTLVADISFGGTTPTTELQTDVLNAVQFLQLIESLPQYANSNITITGHSLGGALAQILGLTSGLTTIVFNAPGAGGVYIKLNTQLLGLSTNINSTYININYRVNCDQVSLLGTPISGGSFVTIAAPAYLTFTSEPGIDAAAVAMSQIQNIFQTHLINTVIAQIADGAQQVPGSGGPNVAGIIQHAIQPNSTTTLLPGVFDFLFNVTNGLGILIDPSSGTDFQLASQPGSPNFASIDLPILSGVNIYALRYETGDTWSEFQSIQPGFQEQFAAGVNGIEFVPLDSNGNPVTVSNFLFDAAFTSTGTFTGALTQSSAIPAITALPPAITVQPIAAGVVAGTSASFSVAATGFPAPTYRWQVSTDGGTTWNNVSGSEYSGSMSSTLTIIDPTAALLGYQYVSIVSNAAGTINTIQVPLVVGSSSAKLAWLNNNFTSAQLGNPGIVGDLDTPANDGVPNLLKYAFNLNVFSNPANLLPQPTMHNGNLELSFQALQSDLIYTVQASSDLVNWSSSGVSTQYNGNQITSSSIPSGNTALFMRLLITTAP